VLDRLVEDLFGALEFVDDVVVDEELLAVDDDGITDDLVVEVLEDAHAKLLT